MSWAAEEFKAIDLGDNRRNTGTARVTERLANKRTANIPGACSGWAEAKGCSCSVTLCVRKWTEIALE